jgi:hypothetical protein
MITIRLVLVLILFLLSGVTQPLGALRQLATFGPPLLHFGDFPPRRQKIFGQCTILGAKKFFRTYPNFS